MASAAGSAPVAGVEHEYILRRAGARQDFRKLIHSRPIPGMRIDPGDIHAYRLTSGLHLTCDDTEAEIASPPVPVQRGFTRELQAWSGVGGRTLRSLFGDCAFEGASTHLSISVPDEHAETVAGMFARTFAPALMLLMDNRESPGLLIRPRTDRVELGGDFATGASLRATAALAAGGVLTCLGVTTGRLDQASLPAAVRVDVVPAVERWGWYVDRRAFGIDLYQEGRGARLRKEKRGRLSGQDVLEGCWKAAREALEPIVGPEDVQDADVMVAGLSPLPCEAEPNREPGTDTEPTARSTYGDVVFRRVRDGFVVIPRVATWELSVLEVVSERSGYLALPNDRLPSFLQKLDRGDLDARLVSLLRRDPHGTVLRTREEALAGGFFDELGPPQPLAPPERGVDGVPHALRPRPEVPWPLPTAGADPIRRDLSSISGGSSDRGNRAPRSSVASTGTRQEATHQGVAVLEAVEGEARPGKQADAAPPPLISGAPFAIPGWAWPVGAVLVVLLAVLLGVSLLARGPDGSIPDQAQTPAEGETAVPSPAEEPVEAPEAEPRAPTVDDIISSSPAGPWYYLATKTEDLILPPAGIQPPEIGVQFAGQMMIDEECDAVGCEYSTVIDVTPMTAVNEIPRTPWLRSGPGWTFDGRADILSAQYGDLQCILNRVEQWGITMNNAELAEQRWVGSSFEGTLQRGDFLDTSLSSAAIGQGYCLPQSGKPYEQLDAWHVIGSREPLHPEPFVPRVDEEERPVPNPIVAFFTGGFETDYTLSLEPFGAAAGNVAVTWSDVPCGVTEVVAGYRNDNAMTLVWGYPPELYPACANINPEAVVIQAHIRFGDMETTCRYLGNQSGEGDPCGPWTRSGP